jgi:hypothetical protein
MGCRSRNLYKNALIAKNQFYLLFKDWVYMTRFFQLTAAKKTVFMLFLFSLTALFLLKVHPVKAMVPEYHPKLTAAVGNETDRDTDISQRIITSQPPKSSFKIERAAVEPSESASPSPSPTQSPSPSPTATPTPNDMKPLPTALYVAVGIVACVFGFGLIVNLLAGKKKRKT